MSILQLQPVFLSVYRVWRTWKDSHKFCKDMVYSLLAIKSSSFNVDDGI